VIGTQVSHYRILAEIGSGGMGVVYKAEDLLLRRTVALKFLPPAAAHDEKARAHFLREARAVSALQHPNICTLHDFGLTDDGRPYLCMDCYEGETLEKKIARGPLGVSETLDITAQAARGLSSAHRKGIIHRDITPGNIFVTDEGLVKILDFGVARLAESRGKPATLARAGTAPYLAPEQIQDGTADERSDLFSLGVVLYECLIGSRPFKGEFEAALLYSILNVDPPAPGTLRKDVPPDLDRIVGTLLRKEPSERFPSAGELVSALSALQRGEPQPPGEWSGRIPLFARRHRVALAGAGGLAIALALFTVVFRSASSVTLRPAEYLVVADFRNLTENKIFDHSLGEALRVSLRQSPHFNLLPPERIDETLRRMEVRGTPELSDSLAVAVARREGVRVVLAGDISRLGDSHFLRCRIIDAVSGEVASVVRREAATVEAVLPEMDRMCEDVRSRLGESVDDIARYTMPLERVTTSSLEALELYSQGNDHEGRGMYEEAAVLKEQAAQKDSLFAMAVSDLSYIHRKLGNDSLALLYHQRVLPLLERVTDRERYYILSIYHGPSFEFDYEKAFRSIQQLVLRYPNSPEGFATLAHLAMFAGECAASVEAGQKSLAIDTVYGATVFANMGFAYALSGEAAQAIQAYERSRFLRSGYPAIDRYIAQAYWELESYDSVESHLRAAFDSSDDRGKILVMEQRVCLLQFLGRLNEAQVECEKGAALCAEVGRPGEEAYFRYLLAGIMFDRDKSSPALNELGRVERLAVSPFVELPLAAAMYARRGKVEHAEKILRRIGSISSRDPYFLRRRDDFRNLIEAEVLLARGQPREARGRFDAVTRVHSGDPFRLFALRGAGECLVLRGEREGVERLEHLLTLRGEVVLGFILSMRNCGPWTRELWPEIHLRLGRYLAEHGDRDKASDHLGRCLRIWEHCDEDFVPAKEAGRVLADLRRDRERIP
jgi:serine/threonine protein kinase/tetratricopeptide (TPR) repeat protein